MSIRDITDVLRPSMDDIARAMDTTPGTLKTYRSRGDKPSPMVRERLATYMRERAKLLEATAAELEAPDHAAPPSGSTS